MNALKFVFSLASSTEALRKISFAFAWRSLLITLHYAERPGALLIYGFHICVSNSH